ncbi:MAG: hypothetical protein PsegKO_20380 [Pseudohongiellaceae bacterium]
MTSNNPERSADLATLQAGNLQQACEYGLQQCRLLLSQLSATDYVACRADAASIGAHVRHILERYQSFLAGLPEGCVDYDARNRDRSLEENPRSAEFALVTILRRMGALQVDSRPLRVRESVLPDAPVGEAASTQARELLALVSHTTHHLAMIAMLARPLGYDLDDSFGKAAATIIHERG